jgi:hypothetical protein
MAANFHMFSYKTRDSLHIKLEGDFDGNSAYELLETLNKYSSIFYQIFIDTNDLKTIHPFGREAFQKNSVLSNRNSTTSSSLEKMDIKLH